MRCVLTSWELNTLQSSCLGEPSEAITMAGFNQSNFMHRYTPSLSRRCTHLVVSHDADTATSKKLALALHNKAKWGTHIVFPDWITACAESRTRLPEQDFAAHVMQEVSSTQQRTSAKTYHVNVRAGQQAQLPSCDTSIAAPALPEVHLPSLLFPLAVP